MYCQCYYCGRIYGEKEPLKNKDITSGECPLCHFLFRIWYQGWKNGKIKERASEFIMECRKTLAENRGELKVEKYLQKTPFAANIGRM